MSLITKLMTKMETKYKYLNKICRDQKFDSCLKTIKLPPKFMSIKKNGKK
jgi:hypothetical protein